MRGVLGIAQAQQILGCTITSVALLLRHSAKVEDQAAAIERALESAQADGCSTQDIAEPGRAPLSCSAMDRKIANRVTAQR